MDGSLGFVAGIHDVKPVLMRDERLEAKYMDIGIGRLPLNTRLMYFDLLKLNVNK